MLTPNRHKTVAKLTGIACVSAAILTGCGAQTAAESVVESATKCPAYDENTLNNCLIRACNTTEGRRKYDAECEKMRRQNDDNPTGK